MVFIVTDGRWLGSTPSPFRYGSTFYVGLLIRISIQTFHRRRTLDPVRPASFFLLLLHYEFAKWSGAFVCWLDGLSRPVAIEKRTLLASLHTPLGMKNGTFGKCSTYLNLVWRTNVFTVQGGGTAHRRILYIHINPLLEWNGGDKRYVRASALSTLPYTCPKTGDRRAIGGGTCTQRCPCDIRNVPPGKALAQPSRC